MQRSSTVCGQSRTAGSLARQAAAHLSTRVSWELGEGWDLQDGAKQPVNSIRPAAGKHSGLSPLHHDVLQFAARASPTKRQAKSVRDAVAGVDNAARRLGHQASAQLFGSQATGLALPQSDLDIVVLGVGPLAGAGSHLSTEQHDEVCYLLKQLREALFRQKLLVGEARLVPARVPILKSTFVSGLRADITLGQGNGTAAVALLKAQLAAVPALRPLSLVLKAFLHQRGLNDASAGGLASHAAVQMVLAHLQMAGTAGNLLPANHPGSPLGPYAHHQLVLDQADFSGNFSRDFSISRSSDSVMGLGTEPDLGLLLLGLFRCYGYDFKWRSQAVSTLQGGLCKMSGDWGQDVLVVEDPLQPGRNIAASCSRFPEIRKHFRQATMQLRGLAAEESAPLRLSDQSCRLGDIIKPVPLVRPLREAARRQRSPEWENPPWNLGSGSRRHNRGKARKIGKRSLKR